MVRLVFALFHWMMFAGTLGFFGIGQGPTSQEKSEFGALSNLSNFATSEGENDIATADNFWRSILSGDPTQLSKVLGPEFSAVNKQTQQNLKTTSEFGNRGGGTNSFGQTAGDTERNTINTEISSLVGKGASALGASGSGLLSAGISAHEGAFSEANTIQQQQAAKLNDLFKSIASVAAAPFTGGASLGGIGTGGESLGLPTGKSGDLFPEDSL